MGDKSSSVFFLHLESNSCPALCPVCYVVIVWEFLTWFRCGDISSQSRLFGQSLGWGCVHCLYWELYTAEPSECCKLYRISVWAGKCWYCRLAERGNVATKIGSQREGVNEKNSTVFSPFPHRLQISWCCVCICSAQGLLCVRRGVPDCLSSHQNIYALIWDTWWELIASCFRGRLSDNLTGSIVSLCETQTQHYPSPSQELCKEPLAPGWGLPALLWCN